ncbi:MAG: zinc ribbon domain-containing protein [Candidatus Eiseniibacteriota bacterium]|jgi:putative FmdB family regulatory protein
MPMYDYKCEVCGAVHEAYSLMSRRDRDDVVCPACGASGCKRQVSAAALTGGAGGTRPASSMPPLPT